VEGVRAILERDARFKVVATALSHAALVAAGKEFDVIVVDLYLTGDAGEVPPDFDILSALSAEHRVLVMSSSGVDEDVFDVVNQFPTVGGYIKKGCAAKELADAVATVAAGEQLISAELAGVFCREGRRRGNLKDLSPREEEVLQLLAEALSYRQIAQSLRISGGAVSETMDRIRDKWKLSNRSRQSLVNKGQELGYLRPQRHRRVRRQSG
jgi:DNA-binding NarL/FixJ family response regulator